MNYHIRRQDRAIEDPERIRALVHSGRFATFALCADGDPYAVTLSYGYDESSARLYFHVAHEGMKLEFIRRNPKACATVVAAGEYTQGECAHPYESVVMRGTMRVVDDPAEKAHAIRTLVNHLEDDPDTYWQSRSLDDPVRTARFTALCFEIEHTTAKAGS